MGNRGEGSMISDWPMLMSPTLRIAPCTAGGGGTTAALSAVSAGREEKASSSGGGATPGVWGRPGRGVMAWLTSGGGAATEVGPAGTVSCERPVAESGIAGEAGFEATIVGRADSVSLISGGLMILCVCSGATRIVA